jgi:hypothetical protein
MLEPVFHEFQRPVVGTAMKTDEQRREMVGAVLGADCGRVAGAKQAWMFKP